jgi:outer membrane protein insertion porin family
MISAVEQIVPGGWWKASLLALSIALSSCAVKPPSPDFEGRRISSLSIHYQGKPTVEEKRLRECITSKAGSPYSDERLNQDLKALSESGLVDDVNLKAEPDGNAVRIIATVRTRPPLGPDPPFILGNTVFSDQRLFKESKLKTDALTDEQLAAVCRVVEKFYQSHGYQNARVSAVYPWGKAQREGRQWVLKVDEGGKTPVDPFKKAN